MSFYLDHLSNLSDNSRLRAAKDFPIVCVGGSAGSLYAYIRLLKNMTADMAVAIVIVNHMRTDGTQLQQILSQNTEMPVEVITERLVVQQNKVFIVPGKQDLHIQNGEFRLMPKSKIWGYPDVITIFLRSLTHNCCHCLWLS
jgi:two-component system chemotaxis response regulator CheB